MKNLLLDVAMPATGRAVGRVFPELPGNIGVLSGLFSVPEASARSVEVGGSIELALV